MIAKSLETKQHEDEENTHILIQMIPAPRPDKFRRFYTCRPVTPLMLASLSRWMSRWMSISGLNHLARGEASMVRAVHVTPPRVSASARGIRAVPLPMRLLSGLVGRGSRI